MASDTPARNGGHEDHTVPYAHETRSYATFQHTLARACEMDGIGLHSGQRTHVILLPAPEGFGRRFVRSDLGKRAEIRAHPLSVSETNRATSLQEGGTSVRSIEHLMASLTGLGIDNVEIRVSGEEIPAMDGSAGPWVRTLTQAGVRSQPARRAAPVLRRACWLSSSDGFVAAVPAPVMRMTCGIEFDHSLIGRQWFSWDGGLGQFSAGIAPARTFCFTNEIDLLRKEGLARGGSLENALVAGPDGWINGPERVPLEPVRHKLLDMIGDLGLLWPIPRAHYIAFRAGHRLHLSLGKTLAALEGG